MLAAGDRLIAAQQHEDKIGKLFSIRRTQERLEEWREARRSVEKLAGEYLLAIRQWRESIESEISGRSSHT